MNFDVTKLSPEFTKGLYELKADYKFSTIGHTVLTAKLGKPGIMKTVDGFEISYVRKCEFYREFVKLLSGTVNASEECFFKTMGVMLDCSRNAVMTVNSVKRYIRLLAAIGYDVLMLYTEDTYEIKSEPFFGYMRGKYSIEEIKEIDGYAKIFGIEVVPCIQTLAHFDALKRWDRFKPIIDCNDILLVDDERTYEFIDKMFATLAAGFSTRRVHIGMDEAHMVGLGRYLDAHGYRNRYEILLRHLTKVLKIAEKYGFNSCIMWSDMFFRLANNGQYNVSNDGLPAEISKLIPENITLMFWDYYNNSKTHYEKMFAAHKSMHKNIAFACGAWRWNGFVPSNKMSTERNKLAFDACKQHGIEEVLITVWGDDGAECSSFSVLPTLVASAEYAYGNADCRKSFKQITGVGYDDFLCLEKIEAITENNNLFYGGNFSKIFLYNDLLCGIYDFAVRPDYKNRMYSAIEEITEVSKRAGRYAQLFFTVAALGKVVASKYDIGTDIYRAYNQRDKSTLRNCAERIKETVKLLDKFYKQYKKQWYSENKIFGFEVQDIRLGGLKQRLLHCRQRLIEFCNGKFDGLPELEIERLSLCDYSSRTEFRCDDWWKDIVSANMM